MTSDDREALVDARMKLHGAATHADTIKDREIAEELEARIDGIIDWLRKLTKRL
jgi:hypothetical protein